ncbi:hypothetical protein Arad_12028 (plasmid) [Rhizobium rhizogenes K84]|uniref:Uncharacterized protein n=1 Tax=Rhizobium rhizogenes (strain K84 / ATCC BAA-868) TaxID=311403 RepID=B9JPP2_RHIR8|nr:hypothetical protein Arad_12028 [Rhizobium rhizogenes K84]
MAHAFPVALNLTISIRRISNYLSDQTETVAFLRLNTKGHPCRLTAVEPGRCAGMFSNNWLGAITTPKGGVVISQMRPVICRPKN